MKIDPSEDPETLPTAQPDVFVVNPDGTRTEVESPSIFDAEE